LLLFIVINIDKTKKKYEIQHAKSYLIYLWKMAEIYDEYEHVWEKERQALADGKQSEEESEASAPSKRKKSSSKKKK